ncbi:MAG: hypothetical protein J7K59_07345 [Candidatus Korarchaeota archaeon]|nr:hypothetical protein [Candidatus Korarchaeota archaeon]
MAKIALISSWNTCCGVGIHGELIGRALLRQGHKLTVFAPRFYEDRRSYFFYTQDEDYVIRNFSFLRYGDRYTNEELLNSFYLDPKPILEADYDLLLVEKPTSIPLGKFLKIFPEIKKKAKTVAILHEGILPANPYFSKFDWDAITVFDERYKELFSKVFPKDLIRVVPFPCHPIQKGDKETLRKELGLPEDAKIIFTFGRFYGIEDILNILRSLKEGYPSLMYLCLVRNMERFILLNALKEAYKFIKVILARPPIAELYKYLGAIDAILLNRGHPKHIAVSSTAHLCIGALKPILCSDSEYFLTFDKEVIKYKTLSELERKIMEVFEGKITETLKYAEEFVRRNSADKIAKEIIQIGFES